MDFEDIYAAYYPAVFRLCMGFVNNSDEAKDIVQETFISVWKHLPGFRQEAAIGTWIFRIATNNCLRHVAKAQQTVHAALPAHFPEPPRSEIEEKLKLLYRCIASLKEADRIIISLVLEGLPHAEIASIMGLSEGNIRVKVHRIKEQLTQKFKRHEQF